MTAATEEQTTAGTARPVVPSLRAARARGSELLGFVERKLGLTPVGLGLVATTVLLLILSRAMNSRGMALLGYGLLLVLLVSWLLGRRALPIEASRAELPSRVPALRVVETEFSLEATRRVSSIIVEEGLDEALGVPVRVAVPVLPRGDRVAHSYSFVPARRGVYQVGPLIAEFSDPFGLTRRRQLIAEAEQIIVHPRTEPVRDRITSREWEDPPIRPPFSRPWPTGFEFYGMREYAHGDDPRRIVWRALAQYDKYLVRESEQGITDRVNIYLDSDVEGHAPGAPSPTFETAVNVAASLAARHLADGFSVSFDVNSDRLAKNFRGQGKRIPLLDELAAIDTEREPLTAALNRAFVDPQRNAHNILITPHLTQDSAARLRVLLERGGSFVLVLVLWEDTDPMTIHRAGGLRCNVVEVTPGAPLQAVFQHVMGVTRR